MSSQRSLFGMNLFLQGILWLVLISVPPISSGLDQVLHIGGLLFFLTFAFGCVYGLVRLAGTKSETLESFYQHFPLGIGRAPEESADRHAWSFGGLEQPGSASTKKSGPVSVSFDWHRLFSFQYLRVAGVILILSSIFSLLFNIDWELTQKIIAAGVGGGIFLIAAEALHQSGKRDMAAMSSLVSFTLFQFALTLLFLYAQQHMDSGLPADADKWLMIKLALTFVYIGALFRYKAGFHPLLFSFIAYCSPLTLMYVGATINLVPGTAFLLLMSGLLLGIGVKKQRAEYWLVNAFVANPMILLLFNEHSNEMVGRLTAPWFALVSFAVLFVAHLWVSTHMSRKHLEMEVPQSLAHIVAAHVFVLLGLSILKMSIPLVDDYLGVAFLFVAIATFCAYLSMYARKVENQHTETLLNLSILISALGLFIQVTGQWSAIIFLAYACLVLWYSLYNWHLRTRLYGFLILTLALFKLYWEFSEIFNSIPGTLAVLIIGLILVALSYKFEAIKGLVLEGVGKRK